MSGRLNEFRRNGRRITRFVVVFVHSFNSTIHVTCLYVFTPFVRAFVYSFICLFVHSFVHAFVRSFIYAFVSFIHHAACLHLNVDSLIRRVGSSELQVGATSKESSQKRRSIETCAHLNQNPRRETKDLTLHWKDANVHLPQERCIIILSLTTLALLFSFVDEFLRSQLSCVRYSCCFFLV